MGTNEDVLRKKQEIENRIWFMLQQGMSKKEIGQTLGISYELLRYRLRELKRQGKEVPDYDPKRQAYKCLDDVPKEKRELIIKIAELAKQGLTNKAIGERVYISDSAVAQRINQARKFGLDVPTSKERCAKKKRKRSAESKSNNPNLAKSDAVNADRRLCKRCKYRAGQCQINNCDYIIITGKPRCCSAENCNKFEKGVRKQNRMKY